MNEFQKIKDTFSNLLAQEESYWRQRAKEFWLKDGDFNTRYIISSATARKERNRIKNLQDENGQFYDDPESMHRIVQQYFEQLFFSVDASSDPVVSLVQPKVTSEDNNMLLAPFTIEDFKTVIFQMHPDKSPEPEGLNPTFFQRFWNLIGMDIYLSRMHTMD